MVRNRMRESFLAFLCLPILIGFQPMVSVAEEELQIEELLTGNERFDQAVRDWFNHTTVKIIGGIEATENQFPYQVSIGVSYIADPFKAQYCSGSLYNSQWVITAAHCVHRLRPYRIKVTAGSNSLQEADTRVNVRRIIVYPGFVHQEQGKDIALLQLGDELPLSKSIQPIELVNDDSGFGPQTSFTITGWGQTTTDRGSKSATLRFIEGVPFVSRSNCNLPLAYDGRVQIDMICAGYTTATGKDACRGDSGGGQVLYVNGLPQLAGVVSWGEGCARPFKYGVYTRVSLYAQWIAECTSGPEKCPQN